MRRNTRKLVSATSTILLVANSLANVMAQDKKQEPSSATMQRQAYVFQSDGKTATFQGSNGQETRLVVPDPADTIFRREGFGSMGFISSMGQQGGDGVFQFFSQEMSFDNRLVKGVPFSAETITESVQTLADGNRIVQRTEGRVYRDSQGRRRNERTYRMGGSNAERQTINIFDPVSGENFTLDPATKTAQKVQHIPPPPPPPPPPSPATMSGEIPKKITVSGGVLQGTAIKRVQPPYPPVARAARAAGAVQIQIVVNEAGEVIETSVMSGHPLLREAAEQAAKQWVFKPTELSGKPVKVQGVLTFNFVLGDGELVPPAMGFPASSATKVSTKTEQLDKQMIEGVECEGTRLITTLPAGAIGNENPIQTIRESWYSPELKITIMTRQNDPRFGESIYRVTNIMRAEPEASLFQLPSDYTIKEGSSYGMSTTSDGSGRVFFESQVEKRKTKPEQQ